MEDIIYALDIGTRNIIGMIATKNGEKVSITHIEKKPHSKRAMKDGQIEDIEQVAKAVREVTEILEKRLGTKLKKACVAAAGRALKTQSGSASLELKAPEIINDDRITSLEAMAVSNAEEKLTNTDKRMFLVGYTVVKNLLDGYPISNMKGHTGQNFEVSVLATFLPSEVIDSLYAVMRASNLEIDTLTLEPIAALNAAIPKDLRLLNLALVDIGAGTSDIAICKDGAVVGYTMATVAGDEISETLMKNLLVDYNTAEHIKMQIGKSEEIRFTDILGFEQSLKQNEITKILESASKNLAKEIADRISQINNGTPSAVFLAGGGSKLSGLREEVAKSLEMDDRRVAIAGGHFKNSAYSDNFDLEDPEYTTPLGIAISTGLNLLSESYHVTLNGAQAKLFRNGTVTVLELLMMNGHTYMDFIGKSGSSTIIEIDGKKKVFHGAPATPSELKINGKVAKLSDIVNTGDKITFIPAKTGENNIVFAYQLMDMFDAYGVILDDNLLDEDSQIPTNSSVKLEYNSESSKKTVEKSADTQPEKPIAKTAYSFFLNDNPLDLDGKDDGSPYFVMDLLEYSGLDFGNISKRVIITVNDEDRPFTHILVSGDKIRICYEDETEGYNE